MTTSPSADKLADVLSIYADYPLADGDAVLLLDDAVVVELEGLAREWDEELRRNTALILRQSASSVVLAIARPGRDLLPSDFQLWRELHEELRDADISLRPVQALPAA